MVVLSGLDARVVAVRLTFGEADDNAGDFDSSPSCSPTEPFTSKE